MNAKAYFETIQTGDALGLRRLVEDEPELLQARGNLECTGLHAAIHAEQLDVARLLIDAGIDLEARTTEGRTALHDSIESGARDITELLLEGGAEVDICSAAILGRLDRVQELLKADPTLVNDRATFLSPLGWAAYGNQVETARELIEHGALMDDGELICAALVGHTEVGRLLIDHGADPEKIHTDPGANALHAAATMKYTSDAATFVKMLLDHGVDAQKKTPSGRTALEIAEAEKQRQDEALTENPELPPKRFDPVIELLRSAGS